MVKEKGRNRSRKIVWIGSMMVGFLKVVYFLLEF